MHYDDDDDDDNTKLSRALLPNCPIALLQLTKFFFNTFVENTQQ